MDIKRLFTFERQDSHFFRYLNYLEIFVLGSLLVMVVAQLTLLLGVNVWRQDSMYYVNFYDDKLVSEGRWINYAFFPLLKTIPASICILLSYASVAYFVYEIAQRLVTNWRYSLALALLILNVPVLSAQLEWPETLLFAFLILPIAAIESKKLPDYIFFPIFSVLFFGSFSAFYFLLPLLFLNALDLRGFVRLLLVWAISFVFGYLLTNQIIHLISGHYIEVAGWRRPHPIKNFSDLVENIIRSKDYFVRHMQQFYALLGATVLSIGLLFMLSKCRSVNAVLMIVISICCALCIYITAIPLGIVVQERTSLSFWIAAIIAVFAVKNANKYYRFFGMLLIFSVGLLLGKAQYASIKSYSVATNMLVDQIEKALPYKPEEIHNLFLVVSSQDAQLLFKKIEHNIQYKHYFSETIWGPQSWVSSFKYLGYNNIISCIDEESGWCKDAVAYYKKVDVAQPDNHIFVSYRSGDDVIVAINKAMLAEHENLLKD